MKRVISCLYIFVFALTFSIVNSADFAHAKKPKDSKSVKIKSRDGGNSLFGSILDVKENELKAKLPKDLFFALRKEGLESVTITITKISSEGEPTVIYTFNAEEAAKLAGRNLKLDLFSGLTDLSGSELTAASISTGTYEITITIGDKTYKGQFIYYPPIVVTGQATTKGTSCTGSTHQVTDISGEPLSGVVAVNSDCTYLNEVQRDKLIRSSSLKGRSLYQTTSEPPVCALKQEKEVAISKIVTPNGSLEAPVELDPNKPGPTQTFIDSNSTNTVKSAFTFIGGDTKELTAEEIEQIKQILTDKAQGSSVKVEEGGFCIEGQGTFNPDCLSKLQEAITMITDVTSESALAELGQSLINDIESGDLKSCVPDFVSEQIIPKIKEGGGEELVNFAENFTTFTDQFQADFQGGTSSSSDFCTEIEKGLNLLKECKGTFCPQAPCFPKEMKQFIAGQCPNLPGLLPQKDCEDLPKACNIAIASSVVICGSTEVPSIPSGIPLPDGTTFTPPIPTDIQPSTFPVVRRAQTTFSEPEECIDFTPPEMPNICAPCETDTDCKGFDDVGPNLECPLPTVACTPVIDKDGTEHKVCFFTDKPRNPFTCEEIQEAEISRCLEEAPTCPEI